MIQKLGLIVLMIFSSLHALEISVKPSTTYDIASQEAEFFRNMLMKRNVVIDPEEAKEVLKENRIFADYFYKTYGIDYKTTELRIVFEEKLKNDLINKEVEKVSMSDEVLLSFYKDNKEEFYKNKEIVFKVYNFKTFQAAYSFYNECHTEIAQCDKLADEGNISTVNKTIPLHNFHPQLRNLLKDDASDQYIVPPQKFFKNFIVLEVVDIIENGMLPYDEVKEIVRKDLQNKIKHDVKQKLLQKLLATPE